MTQFFYRAISSDGKVVNGRLDAGDRRSAIEQLQTSGYLPISAEASSDRPDLLASLRRLHEWRGKARRRDVTALTRELATLIGAGVPLDVSLEMLERQSTHEALRMSLKEIRTDVRSGQPLSKALSKHPQMFDGLFVSLVRAGEASGSLEGALSHLADYRERSDAFRSSVVAALTYPAILVVTTGLSLVVLMSFVVPKFVPLFEDVGAILPLPTRIVFTAAEFLQSTWWLLLATVLALALWTRWWFGKAQNRYRLHHWLLGAPLLGEVLLCVETARFTRTLGALLNGGLPLLSALRLSREAAQNVVVSGFIGRAIELIRAGGRLTEALRRENLLPSVATELIMVGEESGQLDRLLLKTAETFEARVQARLKQVLTLLEPVVILGLGAVIALVIVAILMAMLGLNESIV